MANNNNHRKLPTHLDLKKLFIDVELTAFSVDSPQKVIDLTGKDTFNLGLFRNGVGFGITNIEIVTNASLQPTVDITFKDLYGQCMFGDRYQQTIKRNNGMDISIPPYQILFDWPPPKLNLKFKGYLGKAVTWILNIKSHKVKFNPSDSSYEIKVTAVPNQFGFFADLPFAYLKAVSKLKIDDGKNGITSGLVGPQSLDELIQVGATVEINNQKISGEYATYLNNLQLFYSSSLNALSQNPPIYSQGQTINGSIPNKRDIPNFTSFTIKLPNYLLGGSDKLVTASNDINSGIENTKILAGIFNPNSQIFSTTGIGTYANNQGIDPLTIQTNATSDAQKMLTILKNNIDSVNKEIQNQSVQISNKYLNQLTISKVFSQLAGDAAYILGKILQAGYNGYIQSQTIRDELYNSGKIIGKYFPLQATSNDGEKSASGVGIEYVGAELPFVTEFLQAVGSGIAKSRIENPAQTPQGTADSTINSDGFQRINNLEIIQSNPYKGANSNSFINNIIQRSAIMIYITGSNDVFSPGSSSNVNDLLTTELKNLTDSVMTSLSTLDLSEIKKFCTIITNLLSDNGSIINTNLSDNGSKLSTLFNIQNNFVSTLSDLNFINITYDNAGSQTLVGPYLTNVFNVVSPNNTFTNNSVSNNGVIYSLINGVNSSNGTSNFIQTGNINGKSYYILFKDDEAGNIIQNFKDAHIAITTDDPSNGNNQLFETLKNSQTLLDYDLLITAPDITAAFVDYPSRPNMVILPYSYLQGNSLIMNFIFGDNAKNYNKVLKSYCKQVLTKIAAIESTVNTAIAEITNNSNNYIEALYKQMHNIFHQWASAFPINQKDLPTYLEGLFSADSTHSKEPYGFRYSFPLQDSFINNNNSETTQPYIDVENSIINIDSLTDSNATTTVLNVIMNVCTKNNFLFIPIPGNADYTNINEIFSPEASTDALPGNLFHVLFAPTPENRIYESNTINPQVIDYSNVNGFEVNFGSPDNCIVKSIDISTDENKPTAESIIATQLIADGGGNKNKKVGFDNSLLPVFEGRSFNLKATILGNAQISPMQYFIINKQPIFRGLYLIKNVTHTITPNDMTTSFEGVKMRYDGTLNSNVRPVTIGSLNGAGLASQINSNVIAPNTPFAGPTSNLESGTLIYDGTQRYYNGETFKIPYVKGLDVSTTKDGVIQTIINNPFYYSDTAKALNIANLPAPSDTLTNKNIIALQEKIIKLIFDQFLRQPIFINSGYRSQVVNGNVTKEQPTSNYVSNHIKGLAADITIPSMPNNGVIAIYNWLVQNGQKLGLPLKEVILERQKSFWCHVAITDNYQPDYTKADLFKIYDGTNNITQYAVNFNYNVRPSVKDVRYLIQNTSSPKQVNLTYDGSFKNLKFLS